MTYCIGWKTSDAVFFIADAAVTSTRSPREQFSSFGEVHRVSLNGNVEQAALKVFPMGGAGMTFAGDVALGRAIAYATRSLLSSGSPPLVALEKAIASVSPIPTAREVQIIFSAMTNKGPQMWSYVAGIQTAFAPVADIIQFGSIAPGHANLSREFLEELIRAGRLNSVSILASALGLIQSYGIHHGLMDIGVGGHFTGAFIDATGGHWHPDTIYMLYSSNDLNAPMKCISSAVRENVVAIGSSVTRDTRCFADEISPPEIRAWKRKWLPDVMHLCKKGKCTYIVFLDTRYWRVVMVEMAGENQHKHLLFHPTSRKRRTGNMDMSPYLVNLLTQDMADHRLSMHFVQYEPLAS